MKLGHSLTEVMYLRGETYYNRIEVLKWWHKSPMTVALGMTIAYFVRLLKTHFSNKNHIYFWPFISKVNINRKLAFQSWKATKDYQLINSSRANDNYLINKASCHVWKPSASMPNIDDSTEFSCRYLRILLGSREHIQRDRTKREREWKKGIADNHKEW